MILLLVSLDGFAQEENHQYKHHRHPEYAKIKNPIAKTEKSIAQGRKLYEKHCKACHGETGKGGICPDLTVSVRIHGNTDGEMFHVITDGAVGTTMKGFRKELSDEMRWHLVNYITSLRKKDAN
jgi:mono/diheme cytochrome c family protein